MTRKAHAPFTRRAAWVAVAASLAGHFGLVGLGWLLAPGHAADGPKPSDESPWVVLLDDPGADGPAGDLEEEQELPTLPEDFGSHQITISEAVEKPGPSAAGPETASPGGRGDSSPSGHAGGGGGPPTGPGEATFFRQPIRSRRVVFVIDRSTSMGLDGGLQAAKREIAANLARLSESTLFQIVVYNRDPVCLVGGKSLQPATPDNVERAVRALETVSGVGGTNHLEGLRLGLSLLPDELFLVTDAIDLTPREVQSLTDLNGGRTVIQTLAWGRTSQEGDPLRQLAARNGGGHADLNDD